MGRAVHLRWLVLLLVGAALADTSRAQQPPDLAGTWQSSIGLTYTIRQSGTQCTWQNQGVTGTITFTPTGLTTTWSDAGGVHSAIGTISERDAAGRPTRINWNNGVVFMRSSASAGPAAPTAPTTSQGGLAGLITGVVAAAQGVAAANAAADLEGAWSSNIGENYAIKRTGNDILWRARSGTQGRITSTPSGLTTTWRDAAGEHSATGTVTERDPSGRPSRIVWSHGVVFERQAGGTAAGPSALVVVPGMTAQLPSPAPPPPTASSPAQAGLTTVTGMMVATLPTYQTVMGIEVAVNRPGGDVSNFDLDEPRPDLCRAACEKQAGCRAFTYVRPGLSGPKARCWLKKSVPGGAVDDCCLSGVIPAPVAAAAGAGPSSLLTVGPPTLAVGVATPKADKGPRRAPLDPGAQQTLPRLQQYLHAWKTQIPAAYRAANRDLADLQRARFASQVAGLTQLAAEPSSVANHMSHPQALAAKITGPTVLADPWPGSAQAAPSLAAGAGQFGVIPAIVRVLSAGSNAPPNTVDEGRVFYITGRGLGATPGVVRLQYTVKEQEFGPSTTRTVDLLPGGPTWEKSWSETAVAVRLPYLTGVIPTRGVLNLVVAGGGAMPLQHPVEIVRHQFGISGIAAAPMWADLENPHVLVPGGRAVIVGKDFGTGGTVTLELTEPVTPYGRAPRAQVELTPFTNWQDTEIVVSIPADLQGNYPFQGARLRLRNNRNEEVFEGVRFGPRMEFRIMSGLEFMEFAQADENDTADAEGAVLMVTHDPGCGHKGNEGDDWFFSAKPLPPNTRVVRYTFSLMNPNEPGLAEQLFDETLDWLKKGIYWKIVEGFAIAFLSIFDSKMGSYKADPAVFALPGLPDRLRVHWENSCWGPYDGIPIVYHLSFVLWAPEGTFPPT